MIRHLAGRVGQAIVASFGVLTIVFFIMRLSGDPTLLLVPEGATAEQIAQLRHSLGFDRPLIVQYCASYLDDLAHLDLGGSLVQRAPVAGIVAERIPYAVARRRRAGGGGWHRHSRGDCHGGVARLFTRTRAGGVRAWRAKASRHSGPEFF